MAAPCPAHRNMSPCAASTLRTSTEGKVHWPGPLWPNTEVNKKLHMFFFIHIENQNTHSTLCSHPATTIGKVSNHKQITFGTQRVVNFNLKFCPQSSLLPAS